jgi:acyl carrier protein
LERIRESIHHYFGTQLARERGSFGSNENLLEQGIIDSLAIVKLVEFGEERFQIEMTDDERIPEHFESIDTLSAFVQQKRA